VAAGLKVVSTDKPIEELEGMLTFKGEQRLVSIQQGVLIIYSTKTSRITVFLSPSSRQQPIGPRLTSTKNDWMGNECRSPNLRL